MTSKEALKMLETRCRYFASDELEIKETYEAREVIEKDLERLEKQDKILEIIFKKNVDIELLKLSTNWLDYYTRVKHRTGKNTELIEEEFDLLKEAFEK